MAANSSATDDAAPPPQENVLPEKDKEKVGDKTVAAPPPLAPFEGHEQRNSCFLMAFKVPGDLSQLEELESRANRCRGYFSNKCDAVPEVFRPLFQQFVRAIDDYIEGLDARIDEVLEQDGEEEVLPRLDPPTVTQVPLNESGVVDEGVLCVIKGTEAFPGYGTLPDDKAQLQYGAIDRAMRCDPCHPAFYGPGTCLGATPSERSLAGERQVPIQALWRTRPEEEGGGGRVLEITDPNYRAPSEWPLPPALDQMDSLCRPLVWVGRELLAIDFDEDDEGYYAAPEFPISGLPMPWFLVTVIRPAAADAQPSRPQPSAEEGQ